MTRRILALTWLLPWLITVADAASVNTELRNSTVKAGDTLNLVLLSFDVGSSGTFSSLICGVDNGNFRRIAFYNTQKKALTVSSDIGTNLPKFVNRISVNNMTITIKNITFADEGDVFQCILNYNDAGEPKTQHGTRHTLQQVQAAPYVTNSPLPATVTTPIQRGINLTCQFLSRPASNVTWEGSLVQVGQVKMSSKASGTYLTEATSTLSITSTKAEHNGLQGTCVAINVAGSARQVVKLNVTYAPINTSLSVTPKNPKEGDNIRIQCLTASNPPVIEYDIMKDGVSVSKSANGTYTFTSTNCTQESGLYSCEPRNSIGTGAVARLNVTVYGFPKIISITKNTTINETQGLTLTCIASGCPKPSIVWSKGGKKLRSMGSSIVITGARPEDAGQYVCNASNGLQSTTKNVDIVVNYKPRNVTLTSTASSGVIKENERLVINCTAMGHPAVKYRIFFNGNLLPNSGDGIVIYQKARCDQHSGNYSCEAYNNLGTTKGQVQPISVEGIPSFTQTPVSKTINESTSVTFTCKAVGCPVPVIGWRRKGGSTVLQQGETYTINSAKVENAGMYVCEANSSIGSNMSSFSLTVQYKPKEVNISSSSQRAVLDSSVTITCMSSANPPPRYRFFNKSSGGVKIEVTAGNAATSGVLVVPKIKHDNNYKATYVCSASNLLGTVESSEREITVLVPPSGITASPSSVRVNESDAVSVTCSVTNANPPVNYSWSKTPNSAEISNKQKFEIVNISKTDAGKYECAANNGVGAAAKVTVDFVVQYKPSVSPSLKTTFSACVDQTISASCSGIGVPTPFAELLKGVEVLASGQQNVKQDIQITSSSFGNYTCRVKNLLGVAEKILSVVKQVVPGAVDKLQVSSQDNSLSVTWSTPQCSGQNAIQYYKLYYKKRSDSNFTEIRVDCTSSSCKHELKDLAAETQYDIEVAAVDSAGKVGQRVAPSQQPTTGKRQESSNDSIPIYAGAAGGAALLLLLIGVGIIFYRGRKRVQENGKNNTTFTGTAMYDGDQSYMNGSRRFEPSPRSDMENGSIDSIPSKASSSNYKGTFGKKKGKSMKENGMPPSPAFIRGETNNSFLAESDGAYEPASNVIAPPQIEVPAGLYAEVNKKRKTKKEYADLAEMSSFSPNPGGTVDDYRKTDYAELNNLGPLKDQGSSYLSSMGQENPGYAAINEV